MRRLTTARWRVAQARCWMGIFGHGPNRELSEAENGGQLGFATFSGMMIFGFAALTISIAAITARAWFSAAA